MRMKGIRRLSSKYLIVLSVLLFSGCDDENDVYHYSHDVPQPWDQSMALKWEYKDIDSLMVYDFYFDIRHEKSYRYQNLALQITSVTPDTTLHEIVTCNLANENGKWIGDGWGSLIQLEKPFRERVRFNKSGDFVMIVKPAMKVQEVNGITSLGLKIRTNPVSQSYFQTNEVVPEILTDRLSIIS